MPVYIRVADADAKVRYKSTGIMVTARQWNENKGRVRAGVKNADQHNAKIVRMLAAAQKAKARMDLDGAAATTADLVAAIDETAPVKREKVPTILAEYGRFVDSKRARYRPSTVKVYEALESHLKEWLNPKDLISEITSEFLHDFGTFLIGKGLANVTVNKYVKRVRGFLLWLEKREKIDRAPTAERLPTAQNTPIYLTLEELQAIANYDLSDQPAGYRAARDLFVAEALTGQRFSDLQAMKWEEIDLEAGWWNMPMVKKAVTVRVPLAAPVRRIIESRRGTAAPLPGLSNQKTNEYIKCVAKLAEIDEPITTQTLKGPKREVTTRPKHELITTHTARRTFVTLALQNDVPVTALLGLTHDDLRTLRLYAGQSDRERKKHVNRLFSGL